MTRLLTFALSALAVPLLAATPAIVAFGDSTTTPRGSTQVYATLLAGELSLEGGDVRVVNSGIGGNTTCPNILKAKPGGLWIGYMDAHGGWGNDPRARHIKVAEQVILDHPASAPTAK